MVKPSELHILDLFKKCFGFFFSLASISQKMHAFVLVINFIAQKIISLIFLELN